MPLSTPAVSSQNYPTHTSQTPFPVPHAYTPPHRVMAVAYWLMSTASFRGLVEIVVRSMEYPDVNLYKL